MLHWDDSINLLDREVLLRRAACFGADQEGGNAEPVYTMKPADAIPHAVR